MIALEEQKSCVALIGPLDRVALCLSGRKKVTKCCAQFFFNSIGLEFSIGDEARLLEETVDEALFLVIDIVKLALAQCLSLLLSNALQKSAGHAMLKDLCLLFIRQL